MTLLVLSAGAGVIAVLGNEDAHGMTVLTISTAEITRFDTLMRLDRGEIRIADAMELLGLERWQVYRSVGEAVFRSLPISCCIRSAPSASFRNVAGVADRLLHSCPITRFHQSGDCVLAVDRGKRARKVRCRRA